MVCNFWLTLYYNKLETYQSKIYSVVFYQTKYLTSVIASLMADFLSPV